MQQIVVFYRNYATVCSIDMQLRIYNTSTEHSVVLDRTVVIEQMYYDYAT